MGTRLIDASGFERELIADMSLYGEKISGDEAYNRALLLLAGAPTLTPPKEPRAGLYGKYTVYKNKDGSLVTDCFILRPAKDPAAVAALRAYAAATDNAELAVDIINWIGAGPNEPLTIERIAREYLEICGEDCVGDPSVGIPECPFFKYADILDNGAIIKPRCELAAYRRPPERQEDI